MPMDDQHLRQLEADPRRQAIPSLRGYVYQIWHSVLRWIELGDNEILFLEGAEDIDLITQAAAETIQIKETAHSGSVTLRTQNVVDALAHFWEHCQKNPLYYIRFRFLTTSERGQEQSDPFNGERGLDYWDKCKRPHTDTGPLRSFFQNEARLPEDLLNFIANASDDELRELFIKRIEWDTGREPQAFVEELIERKIISHGDRLGFLPPTSINAIPHLLKKVCEVICQSEDRRLDRIAFLRLFSEVTTVNVPATYIQRMMEDRHAALDAHMVSTYDGFRVSGRPQRMGESTLSTGFNVSWPVSPTLAQSRASIVSLS